MLGEITHLQTLTDDLKALTMDPHKLPPASEQVSDLVRTLRTGLIVLFLHVTLVFWISVSVPVLLIHMIGGALVNTSISL